MEGRNNDCFDHEALFNSLPTSAASNDHACLKEFLLEPSVHDAMGCDGICFPTTQAASSYPYNDAIGDIYQNNYPNIHNSYMNYDPNMLQVPDTLGYNSVNTRQYQFDELSLQALYQNGITPHVREMSQDTNPYQPSIMQPNEFMNYKSMDMKMLNNSSTPDRSPGITTTTIRASHSDSIASVSSTNSSGYVSSPAFNIDNSFQSKMDLDPFSPSISSNSSSVPSVELSDNKIGSVDSGVVVSGPLSSPLSMCESNRNGDNYSVTDIVSPRVNEISSERSIERTPDGMQCSPTVNTDHYAPTVSLEEVKPEKKKEKSHKGRKRKRESKKDKKHYKKHVPLPRWQSQISPGGDGIRLKICLATPFAPHSTGKKKKLSKTALSEPMEQSPWGDRLPEVALHKIFKMVTDTEGSLPFLVKMSQVCRLWRNVAIKPSLWHTIDLAGKWVSKNRVVNDHNFRWLCENRLAKVQDLNLGGWTFLGIPAILDKIARSCTDLRGIGLTGWESLTAEHVRYIVTNFPKLEKINLSGINPVQGGNSKSGVSTLSLTYLIENVGERLTQLVIADNRLAGIPTLINGLAEHCPNLQLLDLSNVRTLGSSGVLHVERLQEGCKNLRVLRITNSQLSLANLPMKEIIASPGFPMLEELSVACSDITQPFIDDRAVERLLKNSHRLRLLDARGCLRITDSSLVRVPAWDLTHLFLSGSHVTRTTNSGLGLIAQKWSHSLVEVDFAWGTDSGTIDAAVLALAEQGERSRLRILDLTGSSVTLEPIKAILKNCHFLWSLNLTSCRGLPRGLKRLYTGQDIVQLRYTLSKPEVSEDSQDDS